MELDFEDTEEKHEKMSVEEFRRLKDLKTKLEGRVSVLKALEESKKKELDQLMKELPVEVQLLKKGLKPYIEDLQTQILTDTNKLASLLKKAQETLDSVDD